MQEPIKFCSACRQQNHISAAMCYWCRAPFTAPPPPPQFTEGRPKLTFKTLILIICIAPIFGCCALVGIGSMFSSDSNRASTPGGDPLTSSPTTYNSDDETRAAKSMPEYAQVAGVASNLGFQLSAFSDNGSSIFKAEASQFIGGREFRFVVMGPARDQVDTIRIQSWGFQTKQARQRLERWATQVLSSLNRGQLPRDFIRQFYDGSNIGDDGVFNGFCNVQVLQKPITPGRPSASDRITVDLIFDKTN